VNPASSNAGIAPTAKNTAVPRANALEHAPEGTVKSRPSARVDADGSMVLRALTGTK
jgi:hypothetical protein